MQDGTYTVYLVQHRYERRGDWAQSDLGEMLFRDLPWEDKTGEVGDARRLLIAPTHQCWQRTSVHGFLDIEDAWAAHDACVAARPEHDFRVVARSWAQLTIEMPRREVTSGAV